MQEKMKKLQSIIGKYKRVVIAFSGGVDSTFLSKVTGDLLPSTVLLVTATSSTYPATELEESQQLARSLGLEQRIIVSEEIDIEGFADNPPNRCYYCKHELFLKIKTIASQEGYDVVFDGSNIDDLSDYRPGRIALAELGIVSPLVEAGLSKSEIRQLSTELNLKTAKKAQMACLASRFPYGEKITKGKLDRVGLAEFEIRRLGFHLFRIRSHENLARVEIAEDEMGTAWERRSDIMTICKKAGFVYVAMDMQGYRTGAMNEAIEK